MDYKTVIATRPVRNKLLPVREFAFKLKLRDTMFEYKRLAMFKIMF